MSSKLPSKESILSKAENALESANAASGISRTLYTALMSLSAYLVVVVASTDHVQLLLYNPLTLPLINIEIDLRGFYVWMPWLYLVMHAYMLLNLSLLTDKLDHFDECCGALAQPDRIHLRKRLHVMAFTQFLAGQHRGVFGGVLSFLTWFSVAVMPVGLLLVLQLDFLPAQDRGVLIGQRWAMLIAALVSLYFWNVILQKRRRAMLPKGWKLPYWRRRNLTGHFLWLFALMAVYLSVYVAVVPLGAWEREIHAGFFNYHGIPAGEVVYSDTSGRIYYAREEIRTRWNTQISNAVTRWSLNQRYCESLAAMLTPRCQTWWLFDRERTWLGMRRSLVVSDEVITRNTLGAADINALVGARDDESGLAEVMTRVVGRKFREGRSLRFARLDRIALPKAGLRLAQLQGAYLGGAQLHYADLRGAQLQHASLGKVRAQGVDFSNAQLSHGIFLDAQLREARFDRADMQSAYMVNAILKNANLTSVRLSAANLNGAQFQGARLDRANLEGVEAGSIGLQGASLSGAKLQSADLRNAKLQGAYLLAASMEGINLQDAQLQGAYLERAQLQGANLEGAQLNGVFAIGVSLSAAEFGDSSWDAAILSTESANPCLVLPIDKLPTVNFRPEDHCVSLTADTADGLALDEIRSRWKSVWLDIVNDVVCHDEQGFYALLHLLKSGETKFSGNTTMNSRSETLINGAALWDAVRRDLTVQGLWRVRGSCPNWSLLVRDSVLKTWIEGI